MNLDRTFQLALERVPWNKLEHAYGPAADTPGYLCALASDDSNTRQAACDNLCYTIYHQGTIYSATVEAVPFLIRMLATDGFPDKHKILYILMLLYNGTSYHEVHRGLALMGDTKTPEYQAKVDTELGWVNEIKKRVRANLSTYLPLLTASEWGTRLYAPVLLRYHVEDYAAIRPVAVAAFERETHPLCRACTLLLMGMTGEPIRPRWDAGLKNDPSALLRVVAASRVVRQKAEHTPQDVIDTLMNAMMEPDEQLVEEYAQVPTQGNITADIGASLSFAGPVTIERVIDNLIADLQKGPDGNLQRIDLMLQLTCLLARKVPF